MVVGVLKPDLQELNATVPSIHGERFEALKLLACFREIAQDDRPVDAPGH